MPLHFYSAFCFTELLFTVLFRFTELLLKVLVCSCLQSQSTATTAEKAIWLTEQEVATGVSCQLPYLRKAVKSGLNYSRSTIVSAALKIGFPKLSCTHYLLCDNIQHGATFLLARF